MIIHTASVSRDPILQTRTPRFAPEPRAFKARARLHGPLLQQEWHPVCCAGGKAETLLATRPGSFSKVFQDVTSTAPGAVWAARLTVQPLILSIKIASCIWRAREAVLGLADGAIPALSPRAAPGSPAGCVAGQPPRGGAERRWRPVCAAAMTPDLVACLASWSQPPPGLSVARSHCVFLGAASPSLPWRGCRCLDHGGQSLHLLPSCHGWSLGVLLRSEFFLSTMGWVLVH